MSQQKQDASKRLAQHVLAREIVELAHGAAEAKRAEVAHREAFYHGTNTFSLGILRLALASVKPTGAFTPKALNNHEKQLLAYKQNYAASSAARTPSGTPSERPRNEDYKIITLPITLLQAGSFPLLLYAAGLASSKSEGHRLIAKKGAYVIVPNSGSPENPTGMTWATIEPGVAVDPNHFLVDWEALVLRAGKSKIQICRVVTEEQFEANGLTCPGWEEAKARRAQAAGHDQ